MNGGITNKSKPLGVKLLFIVITYFFDHAPVAKLVDAPDLGSGGQPCWFDSSLAQIGVSVGVAKSVDASGSKLDGKNHAGSTPATHTNHLPVEVGKGS